ncbi:MULTISPECIES: transporter substrate-binding domain-containing protein [Thalassospira]|uniref:Amino acid ABC transporter substrate-binding protein, PAAT family n=1 Tax=Thalassospira xiamenensis TaxID=220697 RepID=A0A285TWF1_9PROT|nr:MULTISPECIES: transporter substrate-binding domain-containing protein [Thalassospira]MCH2273138.1 transporter substrate-binding domain-containing protein [Thalassospira sp.]SOC29188.1 amino acid ABC transporter substrate-binding protein, PAAT family [Thalassospira xiamenensis]
MKQVFRWFGNLMGSACLAIAFSADAKAKDPINVRVGSYEYGVVYFFDGDKPAGFAPELIAALNAIQSTYFFQLVETSSRRRYRDLAAGMFDMVLLESSDWEWDDQNVVFSDPIVTEHDLYVARRRDIPGPSWFDEVTSRNILCVLGFHYGFSGFNSNPDYLRDNFNVSLLYNEQQVLEELLSGSGDVGIVSAGFLARTFQAQPELAEQVFIGPKPDSSYDLVSVMSEKSVIPVNEFNDLIRVLHTSGNIAKNWRELHQNLSKP